MQECLAAEHGRELLADALEEFLDGSAVPDKCGAHLETAGGDVADGGLDVVGDPFYEVGAVLVLHVQHLLVHLLHGHSPAEHRCYCEVPSVAGVTGRHHVLSVEHLLRQLWDREGAVLLGTATGEGSKPGHEEVETGEGDHVDRQLPEIGVELSGESQTGGHTRHCGGHEVIQVAVCGGSQLEGPETDVVESLVIDAESLVRVFYQLVDRERGVVRLYDSVRHFWRGYDAECHHYPVGVLLADLGDEEGAHPGPCAAPERVGQLESLQTVAAFCLLADYIEN